MIFLVGYRGTGKTTVARLLAERLGWSWLDADAVLEARFGRSIPDIFAADGEAAFRLMEASILEDLCQLEKHVIATGGGVVLSAANRKRMRQTGRVVWLVADVDTICARLETDSVSGKQRPPLTVGGRAEVEKLLRVREPLYRACADVIIETARRPAAEIVEEAIRALGLQEAARRASKGDPR
jgi:shikimate kinase